MCGIRLRWDIVLVRLCCILYIGVLIDFTKSDFRDALSSFCWPFMPRGKQANVGFYFVDLLHRT